MRIEILDENSQVINTILCSEDFAEENFKGMWRKVEDVESENQSSLKKITKLAFKNRFPREKWKAAKLASSSDRDVADFFESFELATYIDLDRQDTINQVISLSQESIPESFRLTEQECDAVLNTPASPDEIPLFI